jgi:tetratricopeptide (TPR) repeat protein
MSFPAFGRFLAIIVLCLPLFAATTMAAQVDELQEASQLLRQGQLDRALDRVDGYLKNRPKDARGRFLKGLILAEQNKPNDAIKLFTELTQEFPELPEPYNNLAVLYASQGQYDKARTALEMAIRTHPSYATAHENLGDIYAKMASQAYGKALSIDKANTTAQTKLNLIKDLFPGDARPTKGTLRPPDAGKLAAVPPPSPQAEPAARPAAKAEPPAKVAAVPSRPEPAVKPASNPARNPDEVVKAVNQWAQAWSNNDVAAYLGYYAADFRTPKGESRSEWEKKRKARVAKPRKIDVDIESPKVTFTEAGRVTVTFRQHYRSDSLKVSSTKTLVMVKSGDKWLIQQEKVGG